MDSMKRILILTLILIFAMSLIPETTGAASYTKLTTGKIYTFTGVVQWHDAFGNNADLSNPTQAWLILDEVLKCRIDDSNITESIEDIFITCNGSWANYIGKRVSVTGSIYCTDWALCQFSEKITVITDVKPTKVALNKASITLKVGKTYTLKAKITPKNATNKKLTWTCSNSKIATVSPSGKVKGVKRGTAMITVTTANGKTVTCKVTVK
jgi:hypothetical protein